VVVDGVAGAVDVLVADDPTEEPGAVVVLLGEVTGSVAVGSGKLHPATSTSAPKMANRPGITLNSGMPGVLHHIGLERCSGH
jgi:hypothetical protein